MNNSDIDLERLANRVKALRENLEITQMQLAKDVGVSRSMIGEIERAVKSGSPKTISKLADYFNVSVDYLLGKTDIDNKENSLPEKSIVSKELKEVIESGNLEEFIKTYKKFKKLNLDNLDENSIDIVLEMAADNYNKIIKHLKK